MAGLSLLLKALAKGRVTVRYPFERTEPPEGFRGRPIIDFEKCVGCGGCVNACPPNALTMEQRDGVRVIRLFYGRCIFCGRCEENCPEGAIKLSQEFEIASLSKEDLVVENRFKMAKCEKCGKEYATVAQVESVLKKVAGVGDGDEREMYERLVHLCPECRRMETAIRMAESYKRRWEAHAARVGA